MERHAGRHIAATIGANIRMARGEQTQREIAQALQVPEIYISRWERGENTPSPANIQRLADLLFDGDVSALYAEGPRAAA